MNGNKAVLDSNFLIFLSKGVVDIAAVRARYEALYTSVLSYIEVYAYDFADPSEKQRLDDVFSYLNVVPVTSDLADLCVSLRRNKVRKIKLPDAVILATAKYLGGDLITHNESDFINIDPTICVVSLREFWI